jgi:hypothetical protein
MENKTVAQKVAQVIVYAVGTAFVLSLFLLFVAIMYDGFKREFEGISFRRWLAEWLFLASIALTLLSTAKWVKKNIEIEIDKQLCVLLVYGLVGLALVILWGVPIRYWIDAK